MAAVHTPTLSPMANKVPEITLAFWLIKMMSTTVGETAADFLIFNVGLGLVTTSLVMGAILAVILVVQLRQRAYVPACYWLVVVMVSIVGTLVSDYLVDGLAIDLATTTIVFCAGLVAVFAMWFVSERTLSIHSIVTTRREIFYWAAILLTFALGTSAGDLVAEQLGLGYAGSAAAFAALIGVVYLAYRMGLGPVSAFWAAYVLTRPFGASMGDLLSQPRDVGGLGFGATGTSVLFLVAIAILVAVMTVRARQGAGPNIRPER